MKRVRNIIVVCLLSIISIATFSSCEKIASDTPKAIKKIIKKNAKNPAWCIAYIAEYECNGQKIYYFDEDQIRCGIVDGADYICDKDGNILCLIGGFDGVDYCKEKYGDRVKIRDIWTYKD